MHFWTNKTSRIKPYFLVLISAVFYSCGLFSQDSVAVRDQWQHPQVVMDALRIGPGSIVADVGSGEGYFTFHLAERVGLRGKVYAEDTDNDKLETIRRRAGDEHLAQIEVLHGKADDPELPENSLDAVLIMNAYHEFRAYDAMLREIYKALKPGGLLGIIDSPMERSDSRSVYNTRHRIPEEVIREDVTSAGFQFFRKEPGFRRPANNKDFFFLIFEKPTPIAEVQLWSSNCGISHFALGIVDRGLALSDFMMRIMHTACIA